MEHRVQHRNDDQRQYRRKPEPEHDGRGHALKKRIGQQRYHAQDGGNRCH